jgi:hypothetical protein
VASLCEASAREQIGNRPALDVAAAQRQIKQYAHTERAQSISEGRFDDERRLHRFAHLELLEHWQNHRAAHARECRADEQRRHQGQPQCVDAKAGDADERKRITEQREDCTCAKLFECVAKVEFQTGGKQNQNQRQRSETASDFAELRAIDQVQYGAQNDAGDEQDDYVRHARPSRKPVGYKRENQQGSQQPEKCSEARGHKELTLF